MKGRNLPYPMLGGHSLKSCQCIITPAVGILSLTLLILNPTNISNLTDISPFSCLLIITAKMTFKMIRKPRSRDFSGFKMPEREVLLNSRSCDFKTSRYVKDVIKLTQNGDRFAIGLFAKVLSPTLLRVRSR